MTRTGYSLTTFTITLLMLCAAYIIKSTQTAPTSHTSSQTKKNTTTVAIHFDAWKNWQDAYQTLLDNPHARNIDRVAISAGRADWTYFRWQNHEQWWSKEQSASDVDMLEHTIQTLKSRGYETTAIFDVYGERYLNRNPDAAAFDIDGNRSNVIICSTELAYGKAGDHLAAAIDALAATTQADTIAITELFYDKHCFDDRCLISYKQATGRDGWPRTTDGAIDYLDPSIGRWRSQQVMTIVSRLSKISHSHHKKFALDVKLSKTDIALNSVENGQDYELLAPFVDEFVVWDYFATEGKEPESTASVANYFNKAFGKDKYYLSIGLWGKTDPISADALSRALQSAQQGEAKHLWITPANLMTESHWKILADSIEQK